MENYWHYWRQGWKLQLVMLIFHTVLALALVPIAYALDLDNNSYYVAAIPLFIFVLVPIGGFLYCAFKPKSLAKNAGGEQDA